jgi:hypothetical protein
MKTIPVTFRMSEDHYEYLKDRARTTSIQWKQDVTVSELIRRSVEFFYPHPSGFNSKDYVNSWCSGFLYPSKINNNFLDHLPYGT